MVTTYFLEMMSPEELRPKRADVPGLQVVRVEITCPEFNRFLDAAVGSDWNWFGRTEWTDQQWRDYADRPELETWVAYVSGTPAGYFELELQPEGNVEIPRFGLLPGFLGRGLGGHLLTVAVERAWEAGASRVWVHTCTDDHPNALANYRARGFRVYKEE